jgi:soluble lytic murein transglycosylase-like protein
LGVNASAALRAAFLSAAIVTVSVAGVQAQTVANAGASDGGDIFQRVNRAAAAHNNESKAAEAAAADENAAPVEDMAAAEDQQPVTLADILKRNKERQDANTAGAQESASVEGAGQEQTSERGQQVAKADPAAEEPKEEAATKFEKPIEEQSRASGYAANPFGSIISSYASAYGVPEALAHAVVRVESNFRPKVTGAAGEIGLMQLKLGTARMMGYSGSASALYDPETNIKYGMKYLAKARQLSDGSTCGTILKYNAGHGAKRMNPVSANYCQKVASIMN